MRIKKVLPNDIKTAKYLNNLPRLYVVAYWAKWGVIDCAFSGKFEKDDFGNLIPLVYVYDDHNGTEDNYYLRKITHTTTGWIITWTHHLANAIRIADALNGGQND